MRNTISFTTIKGHAYVWLGLPILMFLYGWFRWWISLPLSVMLIYTLCRDLREERRTRSDSDAEWSDVKVNTAWNVTVLLIPLLLISFGMGGFLPQHYDYLWRNAVFYDLVHHSWPVTYEGDEPRMLCYYFAYWLPSTLISKATGYLLPGDIIQVLWGWWGTVIAYCLLISRLGGRAKWWHFPFVVLFGFWDQNIIDRFGDSVAALLGIDDLLLLTRSYLSFGFMHQMFMIFNQCLPCWVALPLIWRERHDAGKLILPCALLFVFAPLPCVGISAAVLFSLIRDYKHLLTFQNLTALLLIGVTGAFYMTNNNASSPGATPVPWHLTLIAGIGFFIFAIGVYLPFIWKSFSKNPAAIVMMVTCFLIPFISLGPSYDLARRSMIPMTIFVTYAMAVAFNGFKKHSMAWRTSICLVALVGFAGNWDTFCWINATWSNRFANSGSFKVVRLMGKLDDPKENIYIDNFVAEGESFYSRYLMKK